MTSVEQDIVADPQRLRSNTLARQAHIVFNSRAVADFITDDEQSALMSWASAMKPYLEANGPARAFRRIAELPHAPPLLDTVERRTTEMVSPGARAITEADLGHYLSIIAPGGAVHRHRDSSPSGTRHLRCNLFLALPIEGGRPIVWDCAIDVRPRMLFCFYPSEMPHASERVSGDVDRVILSFGYTVPDTHTLFVPATAGAGTR